MAASFSPDFELQYTLTTDEKRGGGGDHLQS
jgi:hypothetical protein